MQDTKLVNWVADRGRRAKLVASVCTGSMILGQAGLLRGKRATTHWAVLEALRKHGATPTTARIVEDGKIITAAGVSAGIDMALALAARLTDRVTAEGLQLAIEYDPQPPFDSGSPAKATMETLLRARALLAGPPQGATS
jgi:transcriptional regulator GlxA family with amidase domain